MLKILCSIAAGAALGSLTTLALWEPVTQSEVPPPATVRTADSPPLNADDELVRLRAENGQLRQQINLKDANTRADKNYVKELVSSGDNAKDCESRIKDLMDFYAKKDAFLAEYKNMGNPAEFDAKLLTDFSSEEVNPVWSSTTEKNIFEVLAKNDEARNIIPSSIRCRSSSCELKIPVSTLDDRNKTMTVLSNPDLLRSLGFERFTTKSALEVVAGEMTIYIKNQ